jgi:hypothetical protein
VQLGKVVSAQVDWLAAAFSAFTLDMPIAHPACMCDVQMVLEAPLLLTWSSHHLQSRLTKMARQLGLSLASLILLLQQHPQLLPASGQLQPTLELLQQLYIMAAASEQAGFGTGVVADLVAAGQHRAARHAKRAAAPQQGHKNVAAAAQAAARDLALQHPQLLLVGPEGLQAQVAAMQARSGLPAAQVAAMLISQPELLLHSSGPSRPPASSAAGVQ